MKTIIMAGGYGTRLRPLTCCMPKPMVPLLDVPVIDYSINLLKKHQLNDILITLQYLPQSIQEHLADGSRCGVRIVYSVETAPLGTAGSVLNACGRIKEPVLVLSGDALTDADLNAAIRFHQEKKAKATIVLKRVAMPTEYGVVLCEKSGRIERFLEKPARSQIFSDLANTGIYILEPEALSLIPEGKAFDFSGDLFPLMMEKGMPIYGYEMHDYWCDIGSLSSYLEAQFDLLDGKCRCGIDAVRPGGVYVHEHARVSELARITGPCYIADGVQIAPHAQIGPYAVLGRGARIGAHASVKRSVVMTNGRVYENAELRGTIFCSDAVAERDSGAFEGSVLGCASVLGERAVLSGGVLVWPEKRLQADGRFRENVVWNGTSGSHAADGKFRFRADHGSALREMMTLGAALADSLAIDREIVIGTDGQAVSVMLRHSMAAGCISQCADVLNVGAAHVSVLRHAITELGAQAGAFLYTVPDLPHIVNVQLFDADGLPMPPKPLKRIRELFQRGEFTPNTACELGTVQPFYHMDRSYAAHLMQKLDVRKMRDAAVKMLLSAEPQTRALIMPLLAHCGVRVTVADGTGQKSWEEEFRAAEADLGCIVRDNGEVLFTNSNGKTFSPAASLALSCYLGVRGKYGRAVLPVSSSTNYRGAFARLGLEVIDAAETPGAFEKSLLEHVPQAAEDCIDPVLRCLRFAQNASDTALKDFAKLLPEVHSLIREVPVEEEDMAYAMHSLIEGEDGRKPEMVDGVKIVRDDGWVLVRPIADRPGLRILSAGMNAEYARELTDLYTERIKNALRRR